MYNNPHPYPNPDDHFETSTEDDLNLDELNRIFMRPQMFVRLFNNPSDEQNDELQSDSATFVSPLNTNEFMITPREDARFSHKAKESEESLDSHHSQKVSKIVDASASVEKDNEKSKSILTTSNENSIEIKNLWKEEQISKKQEIDEESEIKTPDKTKNYKFEASEQVTSKLISSNNDEFQNGKTKLFFKKIINQKIIIKIYDKTEVPEKISTNNGKQIPTKKQLPDRKVEPKNYIKISTRDEDDEFFSLEQNVKISEETDKDSWENHELKRKNDNKQPRNSVNRQIYNAKRKYKKKPVIYDNQPVQQQRGVPANDQIHNRSTLNSEKQSNMSTAVSVNAQIHKQPTLTSEKQPYMIKSVPSKVQDYQSLKHKSLESESLSKIENNKNKFYQRFKEKFEILV